MNETNTVDGANGTFVSTVHEQFANAIGKALTDPTTADGVGRPWRVRTFLHSDAEPPLQTSAATTVALRLEGDLAGEVLLCLGREGAALLLGQAAELDSASTEAKWLELLSACEGPLIRALEPVFGTVAMHAPRATSSQGLRALAELRIQQVDGAEEAVIRIVVDPALGACMERLAMATRALSNNTGSPPNAEDRERLHRVIDVPLAVTLRFGQRQMTLRELLALSTGSLVELDRQVEEPVELMLGGRVVARGEVVIVDGNYGMRVIEVIEGTGTRAAPVVV